LLKGRWFLFPRARSPRGANRAGAATARFSTFNLDGVSASAWFVAWPSYNRLGTDRPRRGCERFCDPNKAAPGVCPRPKVPGVSRKSAKIIKPLTRTAEPDPRRLSLPPGDVAAVRARSGPNQAVGRRSPQHRRRLPEFPGRPHTFQPRAPPDRPIDGRRTPTAPSAPDPPSRLSVLNRPPNVLAFEETPPSLPPIRSPNDRPNTRRRRAVPEGKPTLTRPASSRSATTPLWPGCCRRGPAKELGGPEPIKLDVSNTRRSPRGAGRRARLVQGSKLAGWTCSSRVRSGP